MRRNTNWDHTIQTIYYQSVMINPPDNIGGFFISKHIKNAS